MRCVSFFFALFFTLCNAQQWNITYTYHASLKTWAEANVDCQTRGTFLATICDENQGKAARAAASNVGGAQDDFWIGLSDSALENDWTWASGATCPYRNWVLAHNEPNGGAKENCAHTWGGPSRGAWAEDMWNDRGCDTKIGYLCGAYGAPPPPYTFSPSSSLPIFTSCLPGWTLAAGGCFRHFQADLAFVDAEKQCVAYGGHLATIDNGVQNQEVRLMVDASEADGKPLIGINDIVREGTWKWVDGTSTFTKWKANEPNNYPLTPTGEDCVCMHKNGMWNDVPCTMTQHAKGFVCRYNNAGTAATSSSADNLVEFCDGSDGSGPCCRLTEGSYGNGATGSANSILTNSPCPGPDAISNIAITGNCSVTLYPSDASCSGWTKCSDEHGQCSCTGIVRYGKGSTWSSHKPSSGTIQCKNSVFGDPLRGVIKECQCSTCNSWTISGPGTFSAGASGQDMPFEDNKVARAVITCLNEKAKLGPGSFLYVSSPKKWVDAEADCAARGTHLATITSEMDVTQARNAAVAGGASTVSYFWIGLNDRANEGTWVWSSGATFDYENWAFREPNDWNGEDCAHVWDRDDTWNDNGCESQYPFLCDGEGIDAPDIEPPDDVVVSVRSVVALAGMTASQFGTDERTAFKSTIAVKVTGCGTVLMPRQCTIADITIGTIVGMRRAGYLSIEFSVQVQSIASQITATTALTNYVTSPSFAQDLQSSGSTNLNQVTGTIVLTLPAANVQTIQKSNKPDSSPIVITAIVMTGLVLICCMLMCTYIYVHTLRTSQVSTTGLEMTNIPLADIIQPHDYSQYAQQHDVNTLGVAPIPIASIAHFQQPYPGQENSMFLRHPPPAAYPPPATAYPPGADPCIAPPMYRRSNGPPSIDKTEL